MGWGNSWEEAAPISEKAWNSLVKQPLNIDLRSSNVTVLTTWDGENFKQRVIPPEELYNNVPPTHDPYTNPDTQIYYECNCGAILDPHTKSFAALNNYASEKGWKIRFTDKGYVPYCVKCGEGVE